MTDVLGRELNEGDIVLYTNNNYLISMVISTVATNWVEGHYTHTSRRKVRMKDHLVWISDGQAMRASEIDSGAYRPSEFASILNVKEFLIKNKIING